MQKLIVFSFIAAALTCSASARDFANSSAGAPIKTEVSSDDLLRQRAAAKNEAERAQVMERAYVLGMKPTADNVNSLRKMLAGKISAAEKVNLVRTLGTLYTKNNSTGLNDTIAKDLLSQVYSGSSEVARAATITYSRMGYHENLPAVLAHARANNLLAPNDYFGEIAHALPNAPKHAQEALIATLASENNPYALEVVAMHLGRDETLSGLSPKALVAADNLLAKNEPAFPEPIGEFGFMDVFKFTQWLHARASLQAKLGRGKYDDFVLSYLNMPKVDPRKILAFLSQPEGAQSIARVGSRAPFAPAMAKAKFHSEMFPGHDTLGHCLAQATKAMNAVK
jgi:hypothetical protein